MRLKRNHILLMKHPDTAWYSGIMMMGKSEVADGNFTAYTDGVNKKYCRSFMDGIKDEPKMRGLIMHETLHVALKHVPRHKDLFKDNAKLANFSADFVVNDIIKNLPDQTNCCLPDGALYNSMFHNWSVREVYNYLKKEKEELDKGKQEGNQGGKPESGDGQGQGEKGKPESINSPKGETDIKKLLENMNDFDSIDEHDWDSLDDITIDELKKLEGNIDQALRQGGILAGRFGAKVPRAIGDLLEPKVDWREVLREFVTSTTRGKDEFTWRKMNKRHLANDIYLPSLENESMGEVVVAIDTSGSIGNEQISEFASELASICDNCMPEKVRVLWWDTQVHGEQIFENDYQDIAKMLKPLGGGGTRVSCVNEYINKEGIKAECVLVFTDGYVEHEPEWTITSPTLWMITENESFDPPTGKKVLTKEK